MKNKSNLIVGVFAVALLPATAQAQYYVQPYAQATTQPAPLYPYAVPKQQQIYVMQPNGYVVQQVPLANPYGHNRARALKEDDSVMADYRRHKTHADRALIEELRTRVRAKKAREKDVINTTRVVREEPIVIEKKRYVDDPPTVIERRHYVDDTKTARRKHAEVTQSEETVAEEPVIRGGEKRVIRAEAEVTILGPDRMSIRLFRKSPAGSKANARAE